MSAIIVIEIIFSIFLLAATVLFAVRETRRRSGANPEQQSGPENIGEVPEHNIEPEAEQHLSEVGPAESS
ncbi:MAG: hypothetical protein QOJ06_942 [Pseudonocardiales bacterium]|jgi:hypothetical protein|nr:hypothetical protein [Pseudonocardiales bacterium]